jgi:hypothetical protein
MERSTLLEKYIQYQLEHGKKPESVYLFMKKLKKTDADFFAHFSNFEALDSYFWVHVFESTRHKLEGDAQYEGFSAAERLSAFYFLWTQELMQYRSYMLYVAEKNHKGINPMDSALGDFRRAFLDYASSIVSSGIGAGQIADRKFISDQFKHGLWVQTLFLLNFWLKDTSKDFEDTDAAIEKTVNIGFKLMGENLFDEVLDFGKFMFQRAKKSFS